MLVAAHFQPTLAEAEALFAEGKMVEASVAASKARAKASSLSDIALSVLIEVRALVNSGDTAGERAAEAIRGAVKEHGSGATNALLLQMLLWAQHVLAFAPHRPNLAKQGAAELSAAVDAALKTVDPCRAPPGERALFERVLWSSLTILVTRVLAQSSRHGAAEGAIRWLNERRVDIDSIFGASSVEACIAAAQRRVAELDNKASLRDQCESLESNAHSASLAAVQQATTTNVQNRDDSAANRVSVASSLLRELLSGRFRVGAAAIAAVIVLIIAFRLGSAAYGRGPSLRSGTRRLTL